MQIVSPSVRVKNIGFAHTAATVALTAILINAHVFIPLNTVDADERNTFVYDSEIDAAPTDTGAAWAVGDKIYWDNTNKVFTKTATSNTLVGYALEAKGSADAVSGLIAFNSFAA
jgi:predicted RecA/RadA family phage recombinase